MLDNREVWMDCKGYEGLYQVSSKGRFWSIRSEKYIHGKINKYGYQEFTLTASNGKARTERAHRLVALTFLEKPDGCTVVNHRNGCKTDNRVENLEWTTIQGNTKHAYDNDLGHMQDIQKRASLLGAEKVTYIITVYKNDECIGVFKGKEVAAKALGINPKTIYNCAKEDRKSREGYSFKIGRG